MSASPPLAPMPMCALLWRAISRACAMSRIRIVPDSAGSPPGPVCYGRGGSEPAVTAANVALGKIDPAFFAGGKIALDEAGARKALQSAIGDPLKIDGIWTAAGVTEIGDEN